MKKILLVLVLSLTLLSVVAINQANAQTDTESSVYDFEIEKIDSFDTNIVVKNDSSFVVEETIVYNFGNSEDRHGIYRYIPYTYNRDGNKYNIRLNVSGVYDENNNEYNYTTSKSSGELNIKIGDADKYVSGQKTYLIVYEVSRAINYFDSHDELFWNVTGNGWNVEISKSSASITLPQIVNESDIQIACYTGYYGSEEQDCNFQTLEDIYKFTSEDTILSYEGLSVVLGWSKGVVIEADFSQKLIWFMEDNWPILFPIVVLIVMFFLWYTRGRDPEVRDTIIPFYEAPNNMSSGELGTVIDEKVDLKDISATIIQLAVKGYLKIREIEQKKILGKKMDFELIKLKEADSELIEFEKLIFDGIFGKSKLIKVSELKNKFYKHLAKIKKAMYELVVTNDYFPTNPDKVRNMYTGIATGGMFLGTFLLSGLNDSLGTLTFVGVAVSTVIIIIFSRIMPRKTKKGAETHKQILGFKWFLSVTETERLKFHNAPEKSPKSFEENLPYAMVLGVEKEWAGQFDDIYLSPPEWYDSSTGNAFGALYLANSLGSMTSNANSVMNSRPSSAGGGTSGFGGGGFSGGGFGGGGGGSW